MRDERKHILLADDEPFFLYTTADLLRREGYRCDCARDAGEAMAALETQRYDLLITDINMPGNREFAFLHQVRQAHRALPVIIVTDNPALSTAIQSINLQVHGYMVKPFQVDRLLARVRSTLCSTASEASSSQQQAHESLGEKLALDTQCVRLQKLETVGLLAVGFTHDMNNMLCVADGYLDLAHRTLSPSSPLRHYLKASHAALSNAIALTRHLLNYARPMHGGREDTCSLRDLFDAVRQLIQSSLPRTIHLAMPTPPEAARIKGDMMSLEHALLNLVFNARDAMPQGGTLQLSCAAAELNGDACAMQSDRRPGRFWAIAVQDTGVGIPADTLTKVLQPFFSTKPPGHGTGLGLPMVQMTLQAMQGWMELESQPGKGTCVTLYLPALID